MTGPLREVPRATPGASALKAGLCLCSQCQVIFHVPSPQWDIDLPELSGVQMTRKALLNTVVRLSIWQPAVVGDGCRA